MTRQQQKEYNAENYPASTVKWLNEATDRAYNTFEKIRTCENCRYYMKDISDVMMCNMSDCPVVKQCVLSSFGCNEWTKK